MASQDEFFTEVRLGFGNTSVKISSCKANLKYAFCNVYAHAFSASNMGHAPGDLERPHF